MEWEEAAYECLSTLDGLDKFFHLSLSANPEAYEVLGAFANMLRDDRVNKLLRCLADIQSACIGEITMSYRLDAEHIGQMISEATGMTHPDLESYLAGITPTQRSE